MVNTKIGRGICLAAIAFAATVNAASISNLQNLDLRSLSITGTQLEFQFVTGGGGSGKTLLSESFIGTSSVSASGATATFTSPNYNTTAFGTGIAAGSTVTSATLDFAAIVGNLIGLSTPVFEASPKSFSTATQCGASPAGSPNGTISTSATGNCTADPVTVSATGSVFLLKSLTIGATTHNFAGAGLAIPTVGSAPVNLASVEGTTNFLSALGGGGQISMTWTQAVQLAGSVVVLGLPRDPPYNNMSCRDCTVYYATTTSASQNTTLQSIFNATYTPYNNIPEPSTYALMGAGLIGLALLRRRCSR